MGLMQPRQTHDSSQRLRVAIAGFDVEGRATYEYLSQRPDVEITVIDQQDVEVPAGVSKLTGPEVFAGELDFDEIWRTPGLAPGKLKTAGQITSGTIEFFKKCPAKIIGVTGTKGKGTTASLIARILKTSGQRVHLVGNIGRPALKALPSIQPNDIVVFELSSFQLWDLKQSPQVAVVVMIEPDHLDVHKDMDDYLSAKSNIVRWQSTEDTTVFFSGDELSAKVASSGLGRKLPVPDTETAQISQGVLSVEGQDICSAEEFGLLGEHNHANVLAASVASWQFSQNVEAMAEAIRGFKGLPHRLQLIASKNGVDFVDDSISTTPTSAIAALRAFEGPKAIILGGSDKGSEFDKLASELASQQQVKAVLIGQTASKIKRALDRAGYKDYEMVSGGMMEIVRTAVTNLGGSGTVLLSPACASFDMFDDYQDRADKFKQAVQGL